MICLIFVNISYKLTLLRNYSRLEHNILHQRWITSMYHIVGHWGKGHSLVDEAKLTGCSNIEQATRTTFVCVLLSPLSLFLPIAASLTALLVSVTDYR